MADEVVEFRAYAIIANDQTGQSDFSPVTEGDSGTGTKTLRVKAWYWTFHPAFGDNSWDGARFQVSVVIDPLHDNSGDIQDALEDAMRDAFPSEVGQISKIIWLEMK
jgi:hypothetical protein